MNILILGLNYAPEPVGIGPYTTGTAEFLAAAGHRVTVICGKPYYPDWQVQDGYRLPGTLISTEKGVKVHRIPIYVPLKPSGLKRLVHHASFALRAFPEMVTATRRARPDLVMCIAPSLISMVAARLIARLRGAETWLHIQDFEVEAAFATGLLSGKGPLARAARAYEKWCLRRGMVSTISPQMCAKLRELGVPDKRVYEFRNWANIENIKPLDRPSVYRERWNIKAPYVALYSGNLGNKQGIEIIPEVARLLEHRKDLAFVICGNGASKERLVAAAEGLSNVQFHDLQPYEMMSDLLGLATVHLLPQIAGAADLVLPSKMANMLASGRPVLATAMPRTGVAVEVDGCGLVVDPGNAPAMAAALVKLCDNEQSREAYGMNGRARAEERWSRTHILGKFASAVAACKSGLGLS
ncbi:MULTISPECIES: WcaI family glycosyltransferase [unclassified Novosphingobium]|uniref:WcaI family glycosyltransferase n=1 Tax=unclassified Novosphingobium TaxID=2644732 RepID=UPI00145ABD9F|nr:MULTISPECIES: WcaI family glycosyltransferase [unclassified Novosphingobium]MBB3360526.1 colanic acid biosynthesis glycosyl transferase WcaI [Novosphingobium sp. BK256]MBB3376908.1 colanic acid biosynthesis glycosyl transferase WcaI [Novosphingobium sp. BK280]MBB3381278.1 colanic acid biosynthesis glycosyl transferase WcaI [Novosphingobium sp. BK258]MBB3422970.1 colanic acid biosynthesis glycosyl transferase WcaI [Novosphingobium sp. BK267]MBB3451672.1 colanic acid biosynthesis glycosyl tra